MALTLNTYGDLKKVIKAIALKQKGEKIGNVALETLIGFIPGASAAKSTFEFVKAAISKPDNKKTSTWLDKLDVDDKMSAIVDDTVENGFMQAMAKTIESESDDKSLEPDFNMNAKMINYLKQQYGGRFVAGIDEEGSTTGGSGNNSMSGGQGMNYATPKAFSKKGQKTNGATEEAGREGMKKAPVGMPSDSKVYDYKSFFGKKPTYKLYKENMDIQDIIKQELLSEATYKQFKKEVKFRTKAEQLHKAMREVKRKLTEIDRIVDYTQRMKQELSEGDGVAYWGRTEKAVAQIAEMVNHLTNKINNLKQ